MSVFLSISAVVRDALLAAPAIAEGHVLRGRKSPLPQDWNSMVVIRTDRTSGESAGISAGPTDWTTAVDVEIHARGSATVDAEAAVDALLTPVYERLAALQGADLGVMQVLLDPEITWDFFAGEHEVAAATLSLRVVHRTPGANLNPWS